jgi:NitT/TauT family transport system ATP-binding protein
MREGAAGGLLEVQAGEVVVERVSKCYEPAGQRVWVIRECSFVAERNKFTVILGPSGCGKTTLVKLIAGYERPTAGRILLDGVPVTGPGHDRLVVFQEPALFPWMTVLENVLFGPLARGAMPRQEAERLAWEILERVGLKDFAHRYPRQLSGGMMRRAELARALINRPRVMLMDEPLRGLDAMTRELMQEYILRLFESSGGTFVLVTQEVSEAIFLADRVIVMSSRPAAVARVIEVDLPRPREFSVLGSERYQELWNAAMEVMYEEAAKAFAGGATLMGDLVEAMNVRGQVRGTGW